MTYCLNESTYYQGVCRTAAATPRFLHISNTPTLKTIKLWSFIFTEFPPICSFIFHFKITSCVQKFGQFRVWVWKDILEWDKAPYEGLIPVG